LRVHTTIDSAGLHRKNRLATRQTLPRHWCGINNLSQISIKCRYIFATDPKIRKRNRIVTASIKKPIHNVKDAHSCAITGQNR